MSSKLLHINNIRITALLCLVLAVCIPVELFSQDDEMGEGHSLSFFEERAKKDAKYEQMLSLQTLEDEIDYGRTRTTLKKT